MPLEPGNPDMLVIARRQRRQDALFHRVTQAFSLLVLVALMGIIVSLFIHAWPAFQKFGLAFIWRVEWDVVNDEFGAAIAIFGTLASAGIALLIAVPLAFGIALFLTETCPPWLRRPLGTAIELLAAVPSIIYGMFGLFVFAPVFADYVQQPMQELLGGMPLVGFLFGGSTNGYGILAAGIVLAFMVLPFISAPMQWLPVVRQRPSGERVIHSLRWGLVPSWAKDEAIATRLINARGESVAEKPSFRAAFRRRRCIVPTNGFYEWQQIAGDKQPFYIHPVEGEPFGLAGLWERWTRPADGEEIDTFTIVTTEANAEMRPLHDRMPVILAPGDYAAWLTGVTPVERLQALVRPCPEAELAVYPVSTAVGNVRNEGAALIQRI